MDGTAGLCAGPRPRRARTAPDDMIPCPDCGGQGIAPLLRRHLRAAGSSAQQARAPRERQSMSASATSAAVTSTIVRRGDVQIEVLAQGAGPPHRPAAVARPRRLRFRRHGGADRRRRLSRAAAAAARHRRKPQSRALRRPARLRRRHRGGDRAATAAAPRWSPAMPSATASRACSPPTGPIWCAASR